MSKRDTASGSAPMSRRQGVKAQLGRWTWPLLVAVAVVPTSIGTPGSIPVRMVAPAAPAWELLRPGIPQPAVSIDVVELTTTQVRDDLLARRYTVVQLTQAFLDRIARYEDHYNAFISMNPEALAIAATLDNELRTAGPRSPLHGVPVVIKDNMDYAGLVTTAGFDGFSAAAGGVDMIPGDDAAVVERLKDAGAVILGKTNMPDFALHGTRTRSTVAGETLNPYAVDRVPGGSSGGTATAVNASFAVLGLGTETGGSIQNPAAAQALVGVKPTFGLVPMEGVLPIDATYRDVVGPLARTVRDAALALDVIAGPTPEDLATYAAAEHIPAEGYAAGLTTDALEGKRFGLVGPGWRESFLPLAPETEALYLEAIAALEAEGAEVAEDPFAGRGWVDLYEERPFGTVGGAARPVDLPARPRAGGGLSQHRGVGSALGAGVQGWTRGSDPGRTHRHRGGGRVSGLAHEDAGSLSLSARGQRAGRPLPSPGRRTHPPAGGRPRAPRLPAQQSRRAAEQHHQ